MEQINFTKSQLDEFLKRNSDELVGKVLSRLESFNINNSILKNLLKDLIHENHRDFSGKFFAHLIGYKNFEFIFKKGKDGDKNE